MHVISPIHPAAATLDFRYSHELHTMPVVRRGRLIGLIIMDNVGEFLSVQAALGSQLSTRRPHIHTET